MKLVKDLSEEGVVLYWISEDSRMLSPHLRTMVDAEEWWKKHMFAQHPGKERRSSIYDRRKDLSMRKHFEFSDNFTRLNPLGRRKTDMPVKVNVDLFQQKLQSYYSA
ncbi:MAG: hypothetical protein ACRBB6_05265 [Neptuniibacter sp.]